VVPILAAFNLWAGNPNGQQRAMTRPPTEAASVFVTKFQFVEPLFHRNRATSNDPDIAVVAQTPAGGANLAGVAGRKDKAAN